MREPVFRHSETVDKNVAKAIECDLHTSVKSVNRLTNGEFNYVYKVETENGAVVARVFRQRNSPVDGKIEWIEEQLTLHAVPHAKTLFLTRENTFFDFGYMAQEFVEGKDGKNAIMDGDIGFEEFFNEEACLLQQIHSIPSKGFGEIKNNEGEFETYFDYKLADFNYNNQLLKKHPDLDQSIHEKVLQIVKGLKKYEEEGYFQPVLLHGDPPPGNTILTPDRGMILIDWDNAVSSSWIDEYTGLVTRGAFMWQYHLSEDERNQLIKKAFKNNYKGIDFDDPKLLDIMRMLQTLNAYGGIVTHFYQHEDMELYKVAKKRLDKLLNTI